MKNTISSTNKPIGLASDHAGYEMKMYVISLLEESKIEYKDFGTYSTDSVDYTIFAHKLGKAIETGEIEIGITICGSGNGITMTINKYPHIRATLCWNNEITKLARQHNNANVLSLPGRFLTKDECKEMVETFFTTPFEGGRHLERINNIPIKE